MSGRPGALILSYGEVRHIINVKMATSRRALMRASVMAAGVRPHFSRIRILSPGRVLFKSYTVAIRDTKG